MGIMPVVLAFPRGGTIKIKKAERSEDTGTTDSMPHPLLYTLTF